MKKKIIIYLSLFFLTTSMAETVKPWTTTLKNLTLSEKHVIIDKGTERAFSGKYVHTKEEGVYSCKVCDTPLYKSDDKFDSRCGWPSFDDAIAGAIKRQTDADGKRTEILCANCGAHLGHVFKGEGFTPKNVRHCVNSISLNFNTKKAKEDSTLSRAYFAGGCFWGVEYYLEKLKGVKEVTSGFMGGNVKNPSYTQVIRTNTGHLETVEVLYDPKKISYETLVKTFFEIHDPTQVDGQGPDIGSQYLSAIFTHTKEERDSVNRLITLLENKGLKIATKVLDQVVFYKAESYHQDYYDRKGSTPYCHGYVKRFE